MIGVLLVDDQKMVRERLKIALAMESDIEVIGTASNGIAAIEQVESLHPDVVIMNMEMPGLDGASATKHITSRFVKTKVLIHTSYDSDEYITKSLAMGAKGYLLKNGETHDLAAAVRNIHKGYTQIAPGLLEKLLVTTDSGVVLSKLRNSRHERSNLENTVSTTVPRPHKAISHLQQTCRHQQEEIVKLRQSLDNNEEKLPQIEKSIVKQRKSLWFVSLLWLVSLPLLGLLLFQLFNKTNNLQLETNTLRTDFHSKQIPTERIGVNGEFSLSGIAERVAKVYEQDFRLQNISSIYVAQEDDAIVLFGTIDDPVLLRRMENLAKEVKGVRKVYSSQVAVESGFNRKILGSGQ